MPFQYQMYILFIYFYKIQGNIRGEKPNVIFLLTDDLGYGDLSYSGHPSSYTPHIDYLARNGRYFNKFYVTSPICSPSRAAFLTGKYHVRSGVYPGTFTPDSFLGLPQNETTMAQTLKNLGYSTQIIGKWHLGVGFNNEYLPTNFGFNNYLGIPYSHDMCPCNICYEKNNGSCIIPCWNFAVSCPLFRNSDIIEQPAYLPNLTERYVKEALTFIENTSESGNPFFLYFAFHHIHHPQFCSSKFQGKNARGPTGDALLELDWAVGEVYSLLDKLAILDNTLIWFASDNGPSLQRHQYGGSAGLLRCGKGTTMEGGVRVPGFAYWNNRISAGRTNEIVSALDFFPTTLAIIGANISNIDGVDQSSLLYNSRGKGGRDYVAVYSPDSTKQTGPYAVIYKQYKAHFYTKGSDLSDKYNYDHICLKSHATRHDPPLLFDIEVDPGERYNLSPEKYIDLIHNVTRWRDEHMQTTHWLPSRPTKINKYAQPCCRPHCHNFPSCCDCKNNFVDHEYVLLNAQTILN